MSIHSRVAAGRALLIDFLQRVGDFVRDQWKSVAFTAAAATILEHEGVLRVFTKLSWLLVSTLASQGPANLLNLEAGGPVVLVVSSADFVNKYEERSPLYRCTLKADIESILTRSPSRLGIDFDLSPLAIASEDERECQSKLDTLLDANAGRLVLLSPFRSQSDSLLGVKHAWMLERCKAGLRFADGTLHESLGLAIDHSVGHQRWQQARMAEQLKAGTPSDLICSDTANAKRPDQNPWLTTTPMSGDNSDGETAPLNFPAVRASLAVVPLGSPEFAKPGLVEGRLVLFGGDYGTDDRLETPLGSQPGIVVHGARVVSLQQPVLPPWPPFGILLDMGIAACFGWLVSRFWSLYAAAHHFDSQFARRGQVPGALATVLLVLFVTVYAALTLYFTFASTYVFQHRAIALSPLVIALSMLVDGFISGPVERLSELAKSEHDAPGEHVRCGESSAVGGAWKYSPIVAALLLALVVVCVLAAFATGDPTWSGVTFIAAFSFLGVVFLLALLLQVGRWCGQLCSTRPRQLRAKRAAAPRLPSSDQALLARTPGSLATKLAQAAGIARLLGFWGALVCAAWYLVR